MSKGDGPGRPPLGIVVQTVRITLSLRPGADDDLIVFFAQLPPRSRARAVMTAMRQGRVGETAVGDMLNEDELATALDDLLF